MQLKVLAHGFRLETRHFRQFLSSQRFVERTAFARLAQLLAFGPKLVMQRFVALRKALADLFHLRFLVLSKIRLPEESTPHSSPAMSISISSTSTVPLFGRVLSLALFGCYRLRNGDRRSQSNCRESSYCQCLKPWFVHFSLLTPVSLHRISGRNSQKVDTGYLRLVTGDDIGLESAAALHRQHLAAPTAASPGLGA